MLGPRQVAKGALFFELQIEGVVPPDHPVRGIDRLPDLSHVRALLGAFHSSGGQPPSMVAILCLFPEMIVVQLDPSTALYGPSPHSTVFPFGSMRFTGSLKA